MCSLKFVCVGKKENERGGRSRRQRQRRGGMGRGQRREFCKNTHQHVNRPSLFGMDFLLVELLFTCSIFRLFFMVWICLPLPQIWATEDFSNISRHLALPVFAKDHNLHREIINNIIKKSGCVVVPSQLGLPHDLGSRNIKALPTHESTHPYACWLKTGLEFQKPGLHFSLGNAYPFSTLLPCCLRVPVLCSVTSNSLAKAKSTFFFSVVQTAISLDYIARHGALVPDEM